jgi:hypothetical protein
VFTLGSFTDTYYSNGNGPYEAGSEDPNLEPDDSPCYPFGDTHGGTAAPNPVTGCDVFFDAIGDLDYDGTSYRADWPTSSQPGRFPGATAPAQPTSNGRGYSRIQFVTCTWQSGNAGPTGDSFGGDAQWGTVNPHSLGAFQGPIMANPSCSVRQ